MRRYLSLVALLVSLQGSSASPCPSSFALEESEFALAHLRSLSDSGVYVTLSLSSIASCEITPGVFHSNTLLSLELSSPHFASGLPSETFSVLVMSPYPDSAGGDAVAGSPLPRSFAISDFPSMSDSSVEQYWTAKAAAALASREASFSALSSLSASSLSSHSYHLSRSVPLGVGVLTNANLLRLIDERDGKGDEAEAAKATLAENYLRASLMGLKDDDVNRVAEDEGADPRRRKVARDVLKARKAEGGGNKKNEL